MSEQGAVRVHNVGAMSEHAKALDHVALRRDRGSWLAGTAGTVVETLEDAAYVELVGPDGATLDTITVPYADLQVLPPDDRQLAI